ncbi:cuticle protein-like isoform X2 [Coccinella septempunctata]|uniref:cuticle protein-like isoform X1 n=1 Tax=Coccinella septempunctata TaxID=41139 RepID=UPI001D08951D|nr:cuticle protein-like isoform X1 [Coccinella septempunctata]XP_044747343.1 cuticle protein-like isoform X2 [Coccinella septempunctata]
MAFKVVAFAALLAVASGSAIHGAGYIAETYAAPLALTKTVIAQPESPAHYDFGYSVSDPYTGDHKSQVESRRGDAVQGSYSLVDSDGTKRTVDYAADAVNGFNAVVRKEPLAQVAHVETVATAPVVAAAPAVVAARTYAAPAVVTHHSPAVVATRTYAAPAAVSSSYESKTITHNSPVVAHTYAAPAVYAARTYAAPAVVTHQAPALVAARTYAAPAAVSSSYESKTITHSSPVVAQTYAAPSVVAHTYAAPSVVAHSYGVPSVVARSYAAPAVVAGTYSSPIYSHGAVVSRYASPNYVW